MLDNFEFATKFRNRPHKHKHKQTIKVAHGLTTFPVVQLCLSVDNLTLRLTHTHMNMEHDSNVGSIGTLWGHYVMINN